MCRGGLLKEGLWNEIDIEVMSGSYVWYLCLLLCVLLCYLKEWLRYHSIYQVLVRVRLFSPD